MIMHDEPCESNFEVLIKYYWQEYLKAQCRNKTIILAREGRQRLNIDKTFKHLPSQQLTDCFFLLFPSNYVAQQ